MDESPTPLPKDAPGPVMDVVPPRPPQPTDDEPGQPQPAGKPRPKTEPAEAPKPTKAVQSPKPPKPPGSGVGLAIFATVIIVLGLAALAVYAYLKQNQ